MTPTSNSPITRALLSVSDKTGILNFAKQLHQRNIALLSTGGTAALLIKHGIPVTEVSDYTGFPEIMAGRVKTLHPKIHGGILARRGIDNQVMAEHNIDPIDLVVANLYPFAETVSKADCQFEDAIENIDIGGPTMVRASAKNHAHVAIVVNPSDYDSILAELDQSNGQLSETTRLDLAVKAFEHTAQYDGMIANYLGARVEGGHHEKPLDFPRTYNLQLRKQQDLRYGENSHQQAAFYIQDPAPIGSIATAIQHQGKALSYNNIADTDAALECVKQFSDPACVIVKHANPCGVAMGKDLSVAYDNAYRTDPESAFGGIIAFNRPLDGNVAKSIIERQFVEVIIAPEITSDALAIIATKTNIRALSVPNWPTSHLNNTPWHDFKRVNGGLLVQYADQTLLNELMVVSQRQPTETELSDLQFAWRVAKFVKSNAIVYAANAMTIGVGAGQMSRVNSARIAAIKAEHAGLSVTGAVMASDAFFPFRDGIDNAAAVGISAIIQPGGSMRDEEVIAAADEHNIAMLFTGMRHFRH